jgi:predicted phosphodiesterase
MVSPATERARRKDYSCCMPSVALISDIHGNLPALEAVVEDVRRWRPDAVYVLGDMTNGACWSGEVVDLLTHLGWPMLIGNHDDAVLQLGTARMESRYADRRHYGALWWTRQSLLTRHLATLESLPLERRLSMPDAPPLRLLHGLPGDFFRGFRPESPESWAISRLSRITERTVAGGHTHVPMERRFGKWLVLNSGSVGVPYDGDARAGYIRLEGSLEGWRSEIRRLTYDLSSVEQGFRVSGLAAEGGVMARMFLRSILSGQPWVADYAWWLRSQPAECITDVEQTEHLYMAAHGPGRWSFPVV